METVGGLNKETNDGAERPLGCVERTPQSVLIPCSRDRFVLLPFEGDHSYISGTRLMMVSKTVSY
jgi:hypothetical protein